MNLRNENKTIPIISIIIPIYNVEKYLSKCIESILTQTFLELELILINDNSPDNCQLICEKYAKKDNRIKVIHKEKNAGVSSARNTGLELATGKWITFIDPDDWIEGNTLEFAIKKAGDNNADILGWNYYLNFDKKQIKTKEIFPYMITREGSDIQWLIFDTMYPEYDKHKNGISLAGARSVWGKLFLRNIIFDNNIRFSPDLKIGEDSFFCMQCFEKSKKIMFINEYLSHYRIVNESANRRYREDLNETYVNMLNAFYDHLGQEIESENFSICYTGMACHCIGEILRKNYTNKQNPQRLVTKIKEIKKMLALDSFSRAFEKTNYSSFGFQQKIVMFLAKRKYAAILYFLQVIRNVIKKITNRLKV